ncbi:hypothetical protein I312_104868 [Cryptococcus bacillisporus CA1280]|uniref:Uncharacterized protein n=2 Tax=Cryptococcus gattii TaxID=552467 RepID=A0A0D0VV60_CRYGA|nr:hypothetical protein I312_01485 [Cryptococcus bacillisporus CA1280]KIR68018.1 hypothetical protein I314_01510 [Cryptococcus bacillisporus CA1873]|eukprot:KIR68018.1 hypothetical protein I314_01510 [Cryptococcus gattii CA1873]
MGFFDYIPCCGPRKGKAPSSTSPTRENNPLLLPITHEESIISADGPQGYGSTERLTDEQRVRIETIGRETGTYMLPIQSLPPRSHLSMSRTSTIPRSLSSGPSSRPSSPPLAQSGDQDQSSPLEETKILDGDEKHGDVVRKTLFANGTPMNLGARKTSAGKGRGKAKSKSKK